MKEINYKYNKSIKLASDEFYTKEEYIKPLLEYLDNNLKIWFPADTKDSNFVKLFKKNGYQIKNTHIKNGEDFLTYNPDFNFDVLITNPPFSIKKQFLKKVLEYEKPFILLVPNTMMMWKEIKKRANDITFIFFNKRAKFIDKNGDNVSPSDTVYICYKVFDKNMILNIKEKENE